MLAPIRHQSIIQSHDGLKLIRLFCTIFNDIKIHSFSFRKWHFLMSSAKRWPFCLWLNMLYLMKLTWDVAQKPFCNSHTLYLIWELFSPFLDARQDLRNMDGRTLKRLPISSRCKLVSWNTGMFKMVRLLQIINTHLKWFEISQLRHMSVINFIEHYSLLLSGWTVLL